MRAGTGQSCKFRQSRGERRARRSETLRVPCVSTSRPSRTPWRSILRACVLSKIEKCRGAAPATREAFAQCRSTWWAPRTRGKCPRLRQNSAFAARTFESGTAARGELTAVWIREHTVMGGDGSAGLLDFVDPTPTPFHFRMFAVRRGWRAGGVRSGAGVRVAAFATAPEAMPGREGGLGVHPTGGRTSGRNDRTRSRAPRTGTEGIWGYARGRAARGEGSAGGYGMQSCHSCTLPCPKFELTTVRERAVRQECMKCADRVAYGVGVPVLVFTNAAGTAPRRGRYLCSVGRWPMDKRRDHKNACAKRQISNRPHGLENIMGGCRGVTAACVQKEGAAGDDGEPDSRFRRPLPRLAHEMRENDADFFVADGAEMVRVVCKTVHGCSPRRLAPQGSDVKAGGTNLWADTGPPARRCDAEDVSGGLARADATSRMWGAHHSRLFVGRTAGAGGRDVHGQEGPLHGQVFLRTPPWPQFSPPVLSLCVYGERLQSGQDDRDVHRIWDAKNIFEWRDSGGRYARRLRPSPRLAAAS